jgi:hypothetical protein
MIVPIKLTSESSDAHIGNEKKIHVINMKLRTCWSKYDKNYQHIIFDKSVIATVIENCFIDAMLKSDFDNLVMAQEHQSLDKLIYEEAKIFDYDKVMKSQK